jgi:hypothetical protein
VRSVSNEVLGIGSGRQDGVDGGEPLRERLAVKISATSIFLVMAVQIACRRAPERACVPGVTQTCLCAGGGSGVQSCESTGAGFGACNCSAPNNPPAAAPALSPDVIHTRNAEAANDLMRIYSAETAYFNRSCETSRCSFLRAPPTPAPPPTAAPYLPNDWQWSNHPMWHALGFSPVGSHYYQYQVAPGVEGIERSFVVTAIGDLDGDGVFSTFRRSAALNAGEIQGTAMESINPSE